MRKTLNRWLNRLLPVFLSGMATSALAQSALSDFNTPGQLTANFSSWNDAGGVNAGNYAFAENTTDGVNGSGGINVAQNTDTTVTYKSGSWNFATNGANLTVSTMIYAAGGNNGDKIQLGIINSTANGLNGNAGVQFESFRFIPASATTWTAYEQFRSGETLTTGAALGNVTVTAGHWYKFTVSATNISGASGNMAAACALFDYGINGVTPGANLVTFSTVQIHAAQDIATDTTVYPAFRLIANTAVSAWDNFLVFSSNNAPIFTSKLANTTVIAGSPATFTALADGPGNITYAWFTNNVLAVGATNITYTTPSLNASFTNLAVVAKNANGSVTNAAVINVAATTNMTPLLLTGFNLDVVVESNAPGTPYNSYAAELNPGEGTAFYQQGLAGTAYGLPASGSFNSVIDGTIFQFQPYTANNALVMSSATGIATGTLTLVNPATYNAISILANSANGTPTSTGTLAVNFADGSTFTTNYVASDWFFNTGFAIQGTGRINLTSGAVTGTPTDPRFYQTIINLAALLGAGNKPIASLTFGQAPDANVTAIYAVSGYLSASNTFTPASMTNLPATGIQPTSATLSGQVVSSGGFAPTITVYYGTVNGGTNAGSWANSVNLGVQTGAFSQSVSNLLPGTFYYYTVNGVNYAGNSWAAPSQSFSTAPLAVPQVTTAPATAISANTATLNGQVLSTGGSPTGVILFYGLTDGGTNAGTWSNQFSLGLQSGAFSQTISGLSSNAVYYFTAEATNSQGAAWSAPSQTFTTLATNPVFTGVPVLTYHNDNTRWGVNPNETTLTLANVNTNSFGRLFTYTVDGFVYAQPLIMTNVNIPGKGTHNVVYVATEHNSVYAFDADDNSGANASPLWQTSFINPAAGITTVPNGDVGTTDITPEVGITSTPVIDPVTGTIYFEVKTKEPGPVYVHRLHALDIATGLERTNFNSPSVITCTNYLGSGNGDNDGKTPAHVLWNPMREHSRPALTLLNGAVYMSFASHGDNQPYHGWMFAYNATNVAQQVGVYNATPNGVEGGFWDGGGGPSVDAQGNMYFQTGNGTFDGGTTLSTTADYSMSLLKLATTNGLTLVDYFAPNNAVALSGGDQDLGSASPIILPDSAGSAAHPHLVVGGGKTAPIYVVDRDNMGRFHGTGSTNWIVQLFNGGPGGDRDTAPAFFNNALYTIDSNGRIGAYKITNAVFNTTPVETPDTFDNKGGATASISANGTSNAIAWVIYNTGGQSPATPCVLRAYNATNLTQKLYASDQVTARDTAGSAVKFTTPTIANGKVYVGAQYSLTVYGLAAVFVSTPVISPGGGVFTNSVTVTLSDATTGAVIYYTLDGTAPTTNSIRYTVPFVLTNSVSVTAGAFKTGAVPSGTTSTSFINSSAIGNGTGLLGQYFANTTSGAFITPGFNTAPTLTRVDSTINFDWSTTPPAANVGPNTYVVRWTGAVEPQFNETYTFSTTTDDGVRLWVNGQLLIDEWVDQGATTWSGQINLVAQQRYNIEMDFYQNGGGSQAQLFWGSPSTGSMLIIPQTQLYPVTNPPPSVVLTTPTNGASYTASASVTMSADAAAQYNDLNRVDFYAGTTLLGSVSNLPCTLTANGLAAGSYALKAVAVDATGLSSTSAPVNITVNPGSGLPYGLTNANVTPAFFNMPPAFDGTSFASIPQHLSQTGVFTNTPAMQPYRGLIPYLPNTPLWSDGAAKIRYLSIPNNGSPFTPDEQITFAPTGNWTFPAGSIFVKTFALQTNQSDPNSLRRLETRLLVRDINGTVYGVTYKWRSDNSEADLLTTSSNENIAITTPGGVTTQTWYYPSVSDCLTCHTPAANYVLGLSTRQLNGSCAYPSGVTDNQLRTLNRVGLLNPAFNETSLTNFEKLYAITNLTASLEDRARSYLDANCVQCHQPGGSGPSFDARFETPLASQNLINGVLSKGDLGYDHAFIVAPRDVWRSVLYDRMNSVDSTIKMPPLARNLIDTNAISVMGDWINSLAGTPAQAPPTINPAGGVFSAPVTVILQAPDNTATLYYTLDGTLPSTNSLLYTAPFTLNSSVTLQAVATETNFNNSVATTAQFTIMPVYFTGNISFTNNVFALQISGTAGLSYVLQSSTNLVDWINVSTNTPSVNPFYLMDTNTTGIPAQFFRAIQLSP
ncbi:MAG TPA: chitobiase/beta-hexosaminidase C-terminal domain-containing protein [Verrucomicrobiae bacterium]|jgi:uncharacterized repeat protein (TIGR03806 family)